MANRFPSIAQIAYAVWNLVPVASRTVTVSTNTDKTGYGTIRLIAKVAWSLVSQTTGSCSTDANAGVTNNAKAYAHLYYVANWHSDYDVCMIAPCVRFTYTTVGGGGATASTAYAHIIEWY